VLAQKKSCPTGQDKNLLITTYQSGEPTLSCL